MHKSTYILLVLAKHVVHVQYAYYMYETVEVHVRCRVSVDQYIFQLDMPEHRHYEY